ncbi:MAG: methyltransferase domain-containing protein [Spirochaetales bacterium]|nr:methyltransferase domain-containing protein [Spirochaetales bacterium]
MKKMIKKGMNRLGFDVIKTSRAVKDTPLYIEHYGKESVERRAFYNVSAGGHFGFGGDFFHPCWTNIDVDLGDEIFPRFDGEKDIAHDPLDLGELPLESDSAELFQSRFAIEHISDEAALKLFREVRRVLKKDGVFKVVVPNFRLDYEAYRREDRDYFSWIDLFSQPGMMEIMRFSTPLREASLEQVMLAHFAANASTIHRDGSDNPIGDEEFHRIMHEYPFEKAMDYCTDRCSLEKHRKYRKNHVNWWDSRKVDRFLKEAGFKSVIHLSPGQSVSPVMRKNPLFDRLWSDVALYVEGVKC